MFNVILFLVKILFLYSLSQKRISCRYLLILTQIILKKKIYLINFFLSIYLCTYFVYNFYFVYINNILKTKCLGFLYGIKIPWLA